ncbi:hypothetical protein Tco_0420847 [Tanacetum coccineum]
MVISSPCLIDIKNWLVQSKRLLRLLKLTNDDNGEVSRITATIDGHSRLSLKPSLKKTFSSWMIMMRKQLQQHSRTYHVPSLSIKVFNNMKRPTKGYSGQEVDLFPTMLNVSEPSTSPSRITSSPSHSPEPSPSHSHEPSIEHSPDHTTAAVSFPSPTQPTQPSPGAEQHIPTPHDSPLHVVHSHGSDEGSLKLIELTNLVTKLSERIGVLEDDLKKTKQTYSAAVTKLILRVKKLEAKVKAGTARKGARVVLSEDDEDVEDDSSKQGRKLSDAEVQEKASTETEPIIQEVTPTEVIQDQGSSEKGNSEVSTAGATKGTASEVPVIKGPKGEQIARDEEIARQWDEEERQRATSKAKSTKEIDWNDPSVIRKRNERVSKESRAKRKKSLPRKKHKEVLVRRKKWKRCLEGRVKGYLDIVPREEVAEDVESLSTKYPNVDWKTCVLTENFMYYQVFRGDGSSKNYKVLSEMLETLIDKIIDQGVGSTEGISNDTCDVPFCDNSSPLDVLNDDFEIFSDFNDDCTSSDDDSFENIDYVEASPPDSELVSLEEVKDDILREKLLNIYLLIAKIESLNDNPTPDCVLKSPSPFPIPVEDSDSFFKKFDTSLSYLDNSLPKFETFSDHTEETSSGSTTTHADNSLPEYDSFLFEIEPDQGELTSAVMEDFFGRTPCSCA